MKKEICNIKVSKGKCDDLENLLHQIDNTEYLERYSRVILRECINVLFNNSNKKDKVIFTLEALKELLDCEDDMDELIEQINYICFRGIGASVTNCKNKSVESYELIKEKEIENNQLYFSIHKNFTSLIKGEEEYIFRLLK